MTEYNKFGSLVRDHFLELKQMYVSMGERRLEKNCNQINSKIEEMGDLIEKNVGEMNIAYLSLAALQSTCKICNSSRRDRSGRRKAKLKVFEAAKKSCDEVPNKIDYFLEELMPEMPDFVESS
ncbi:MAG: hypothetical protein JW700_00650 [Candidatus Aenigmarchaeota archaeon]|nr:hypothetical protein [Candidatus Aenigmarchaeota archaeon]